MAVLIYFFANSIFPLLKQINPKLEYASGLSGNFDIVSHEERKAAGLDGGCKKPFSFEKANEVIRTYKDIMPQK